jgi:hypothetical protein
LDLTDNVGELFGAVGVVSPCELDWERFLVVSHFRASNTLVAVNNVAVAWFTHPVKQQRLKLQVLKVLLVVNH